MKALVIVDAATRVPAIAFRMSEPTNQQSDVNARARVAAILERGGFGASPAAHQGYVVLLRAVGPAFRAEWNAFAWDDLTMTCAHRWLEDHLEEHPAGDELDVEAMRLALVRGWEQAEPAVSVGHHDHDDPRAVG